MSTDDQLGFKTSSKRKSRTANEPVLCLARGFCRASAKSSGASSIIAGRCLRASPPHTIFCQRRGINSRSVGMMARVSKSVAVAAFVALLSTSAAFAQSAGAQKMCLCMFYCVNWGCTHHRRSFRQAVPGHFRRHCSHTGGTKTTVQAGRNAHLSEGNCKNCQVWHT